MHRKSRHRPSMNSTRTATWLCFLLLGVITAAQAQEPSITISPTYVSLGSAAPGTPYNVRLTVFVFGLGTTVSASGDPAIGVSGLTSIVPASTFIAQNNSADFDIRGTFPATTGPFTQYIKFTYSNSSGPVTFQAEISGNSSTGGTWSLDYSVGIIPNSQACPADSPLVTFHMDDEDSDNANSRSGWKGAITSDSNTTFRFCRVDGTRFFPLSSTNTVQDHYAVLKMGTRCPNGSTEFFRDFDNENRNNKNSMSTTSGNNSDFGPNFATRNSQGSTRLVFCLFKSGANTMSQFPSFGIQYGIFAAPGFSKAVASGWIHTDDQDSNRVTVWNGNFHSGDADARRIIVPLDTSVQEDENTRLNLARVTQETRPTARCSASPAYGDYAVSSTFTAAGSTAAPGRTLTSYSWEFSNGASPASGEGPHTRMFYNYSGPVGALTFYGTVTVTDSFGETGIASCSITVYKPQ